MSDLMLPSKGQSAASLLQELNADHAPDAEMQTPKPHERTKVTTLQETNEAENGRTPLTTNDRPRRRKGTAPSSPPSSPSDQRPQDRAPGTSDAATMEADAPDGSLPAAAGREHRYSRALGQSEEDEIAVVTVRVSGRLNEYMDRYVERMNRIHPKRRYRKQDAVAEAFAAFYADHPMPPAPEEDDL